MFHWLEQVKDVDAAIDLINDKPKPLAVYLFTNNKDHVKKFTEETSSGALVTNDCVLQVSDTFVLISIHKSHDLSYFLFVFCHLLFVIYYMFSLWCRSCRLVEWARAGLARTTGRPRSTPSATGSRCW